MHGPLGHSNGFILSAVPYCERSEVEPGSAPVHAAVQLDNLLQRILNSALQCDLFSWSGILTGRENQEEGLSTFCYKERSKTMQELSATSRGIAAFYLAWT